MKFKQIKKFYKQYEFILMIMVILFAVISAGAILRLQSSFSTSGIWDASAEISGVEINNNYVSYGSLSAIEKSKNKVSWEPDGSANLETLSSMDAVGLMPQVEVTVGSLFHVNSIGTPTRETGPNEIEDIEGIRYVKYYFGFSISLLTRGSHHDISPIYDFDYYGENIHLYENPNFASVLLGGEIGLKLTNNDDTVPTECGVQVFKLLDYETRYTTALSQGYEEDISDFNREYNWDDYSHKGSISEPREDISFYDLNADYSGKIKVSSMLEPASEYAPTWSWGVMTGGTFNVWDVELLLHYMCEVVLTYELAADVDNYLEGRLDIGGIAEPEVYDFWYYMSLFISGILDFIMDVFGLTDIWSAWLALIVIVVSVIILLKLIRNRMANRSRTTIIYGY